jgi:hypothetical protein
LVPFHNDDAADGDNNVKVLKGCAVAILGSLLFTALSVFGLGLLVDRTVLNPEFVTSEINRIDLTGIIKDTLLKQQNDAEVSTVIADLSEAVEPVLKQHVDDAVYDVYDYLLGKTRDISLAQILRSTVLSTDFLVDALDKVDISQLTSAFLQEQIQNTGSSEFLKYVTADDIAAAAESLKPWLKSEIRANADTVLDYYVGLNDGFSVDVSLQPAIETMKSSVRTRFLSSPPSEYAGLDTAALSQAFDGVWASAIQDIPPILSFEQSGGDMSGITSGFHDVETTLVQIRDYAAIFHRIFYCLLAFILLLILLIVLVFREIRASTRSLSITFLTYGVIEYAGVWVLKIIAASQLDIALQSIPAYIQPWIRTLVFDAIRPLEIFSLAVAVTGLILLMVSIMYRPAEQTATF